jgi:hypothetical protein
LAALKVKEDYRLKSRAKEQEYINFRSNAIKKDIDRAYYF